MNVVIYARFSDNKQREESIEGQLRECLDFAAKKGYTVIGSYVDRAIPGKSAANRPQFMKMIADSSTGEFEAVLVWKTDRFGRNRFEIIQYKCLLLEKGIRVISATEFIDDTPEGVLVESMLEGMSEYYSKDLCVKVVRGMTENTLKGKFNGGSVTFGYKIDKNKHFEKDSANARIVEDVFMRYANGETIKSIVDDLNSRGITNNGKKITYHSINWLLKNRRYLGEYNFRDKTNYDAIPAIIAKELFDECQKRLEINKHKSASFKEVEEKYLLTGKIHCGICGDTMSGISGTGKNRIYRYYQCMSSKKHKCKKKTIRKEYIETAVIAVTMAIFNDKKLIKSICNACYKLQDSESTVLPSLKKQLANNKKEIENVIKAIKAGIVTKTTKATLEKLEEEKEKLEVAISAEKIKRPTISRKEIEAWIMRFAGIDITNENQKQELINIFVNNVLVYDDRIVVMLNYRDGEKSITFDEINEYVKKSNASGKCSTLLMRNERRFGANVFADKDKKSSTRVECSTLIMSGDPYGNRKSNLVFHNFL